MSHPSWPTSLHEASQPVIPRKRNSDALIELSDSDSDAPRPKKPRLDPQQKHPLLVVNSNLPPYITTQRTMVVPNPPVMTAPAASPSSVMPQPTPMGGPSLPQAPLRSINEILDERARVANDVAQMRAVLSIRPEIDRNLANDQFNAWQPGLSVVAEMQTAAAPERLPRPPFLVPPSSGYASVTPESAPTETTHDAYPKYLESEGETSKSENDQSNGHPPLPMPNHAISTAAFSQPAKYVGATECPQHSLTIPIVYRNSFKTAIETFLTLMLPFKKVSRSSDCVI